MWLMLLRDAAGVALFFGLCALLVYATYKQEDREPCWHGRTVPSFERCVNAD